MSLVNTHDTLETLHAARQTVAQFPTWLALAEQVEEHMKQVEVKDAYSRADAVMMLTTYGYDELKERFPGWEITHEIEGIGHRGATALMLLTRLELLASAPDLVAELVAKARDNLRTALLAGVTLD